jgi:D-serine deaminase-like pyridoxal phosphate-dependent protein
VIGMSVEELDTPALIIDLAKMEKNLKAMQDLVNSAGIKLRPHTKTHKMADIARLQLEYGASGITVAKLGEAEAMVEAGITDIFIATEIVGEQKLVRLRSLADKAKVRVAVDSIYHVEQLSDFFKEQVPVEVMIEVDTGMHRCGIKPEESIQLAGGIVSRFPQMKLAGIFAHEGHTYDAADKEQMKQIALDTQRDIIETGNRIKEKWVIQCENSVGCKPVSYTLLRLPTNWSV